MTGPQMVKDSEEEIDKDQVGEDNNIMWENLPDPVLLGVFALLDTDHLHDVAARVCKRWRLIAQSVPLWKNRQLTYIPWDIWEEEEETALKFSNIFQFAPCLASLTLGLQESNAQSVVSALKGSECQIHSLTLTVEEYNPVVATFLNKHMEIEKLTVIDQCCSSVWAHKISNVISCMRLSVLNLNRSQLLHHKGIQLQGLLLKRLEYCPSEFTYEIADPELVLADIITSSLQSLRFVRLRAPYKEVFVSLAGCSCLEEVEVMCGDSIMEFLKAGSKSTIKSLHLSGLPDPSDSIFEALASFQHLCNLEISSCSNFPGLSLMYPMISSLKTLVLSDVSYVGLNELKDLLSISPLSLKEIFLSDCPCSATASYSLCRDRLLSDLLRCGTVLTVCNHDEMDDRFDVGCKPAYNCKCDHRKPR